MIKETDLDALQRKFGLLLSLLYEAGLSYDAISENILKNPYFDFLENNQADGFMADSFEGIAQGMFDSPFHLDEGVEANTKLLWAGFCYIDLSVRLKKPLRQLFLLCPLKEIIALFEPYHEMPENALGDYFQKEIYKRNILRTLLTRKKIKAQAVSYYCGCSVPLIWSYCGSNDRLFSASSRILASLVEVLGEGSRNLLKGKSSFVYYSSFFLFDSNFINLLGASLKALLPLNKAEAPFVYVKDGDVASASVKSPKSPIMVTYLPPEIGHIKRLLAQYHRLIFIGPVSSYFETTSNNGFKKKVLNPDLVDLAFKKACYQNNLL